MRKAHIAASIALAGGLALAAPCAAFAAGTAPTGRSTSSGAQTAPVAHLSLSSPTVRAGGSLVLRVSAQGGTLAKVDVSSSALSSVKWTQNKDHGFIGIGVVAKTAKPGTHKILLTAVVGARKVDASADLVVRSGSSKTPAGKLVGGSGVTVRPGEGRPGDRVQLAVTAPSANPTGKVTAESQAFVGKVHLALGKDGIWKGTARVADVRPNTYQVRSGTGAHTTFKVLAGQKGAKSAGHGGTTPLKPGEHKTPKGAVNTGMAPAAHSQGGTSTTLLLGVAAGGLGAAAIASGLLRQRVARNGN